MTWNGSFGISGSVVGMPSISMDSAEISQIAIERFPSSPLKFAPMHVLRFASVMNTNEVEGRPLVRPNELLMDFNELINVQTDSSQQVPGKSCFYLVYRRT